MSNPNQQRKFLKAVGVVSCLTFSSRVLGLFREIIRASYLGTSFLNDAFVLAFALPNLFRRFFAEGTMVNAFIPVFTEIKKKEGQNAAVNFAHNFFVFLTIILTFFAVILIGAMPILVKYIFAVGFHTESLQLTIFLSQLMFPYLVVISLAALCQGILNVFSIFWVSAFTPVLLNISIILAAWFLSDYCSNPTYAFSIGVLIGGCLQLFFQIPFLKRCHFTFWRRINFHDANIKKVTRLMLPGIFGAGVYQINIIASNTIASTLPEGSLSALSFSNRLLELALGVFIISIATIILPDLAQLHVDGKETEKVQKMKNALTWITFITLPVMAGIIVSGRELVAVLFKRGAFDEHSLQLTFQALIYHIPGLIFIGWNRVLLTSFYASQEFKKPVYVATIVMIINIVCSLILIKFYAHAGIAFANTISQVLQTILLLLIIKSALPLPLIDQFLIKDFIIIIFITGIMTAILLYAKEWLLLQNWNQYLQYTAIVLIGSGSYLMFSMIFKNFLTFFNFKKKTSNTLSFCSES